MSRFTEFVSEFTTLLETSPAEPLVLQKGGALLAQLVSKDDWLADQYAQPDPKYYCQYLLYYDQNQCFSIVSFVWGPGQRTPIHDHTVWGLVGVLRGAELSQSYQLNSAGRLIKNGGQERIETGQVVAVSPTVGDIHSVHNAFDDRVSISIHIYGADIGSVKRSVFGADGQRKDFISGYSNPA